MTEKLLNGGTTTWLIRALWSVLFVVGGYFIQMNDKRLGAIEARTDYMMRENADRETKLADRLARLEERVRLHQQRARDKVDE